MKPIDKRMAALLKRRYTEEDIHSAYCNVCSGTLNQEDLMEYLDEKGSLLANDIYNECKRMKESQQDQKTKLSFHIGPDKTEIYANIEKELELFRTRIGIPKTAQEKFDTMRDDDDLQYLWDSFSESGEGNLAERFIERYAQIGTIQDEYYDIIDGTYWFCMDYHGGASSDKYAIGSNLGSIYKPSILANGPEEGSAQEIYNALARLEAQDSHLCDFVCKNLVDKALKAYKVQKELDS